MSLAIYNTKNVAPRHQGNPLIEALQPTVVDKDVFKLLARKPDIVVRAERALPPQMRVHSMADIGDMFLPDRKAVDLYATVDIELKRGLKRRSPFTAEAQRTIESVQEQMKDKWERSKAAIETAIKAKSDPLDAVALTLPSSLRSILVIAPSGRGKSVTVRNVLMVNPQVIEHSEYQGRTFKQKQIVWLSVQAPLNASISGICLSLLGAVDSVLRLRGEDSYVSQYSKARTNEILICRVAQVMATHFVGVLHIDDVQRISDGTGAHIGSLISFLMQLSDVVGVPLILSGTSKLIKILNRSMEVGRRVCSGTTVEMTLERKYEKTGAFGALMRGAFKFQILDKDCPNPEELMEYLFDRSQAVNAVAMMLFIQAQIIGMRRGEEVLTKELIDVAYEGILPLHNALDVLRRGDVDALAQYEDLLGVSEAMNSLWSKMISGGRP
ncbi:ATP-binding protein [Herbaspirillum camelliae]|uniref:ATP-binding protein n=1 Tax=Herbaspirillum camelliae TaxID=1892903 RepID=UPI0009F9E631|nr:ATP-binding protein [Herbaspirillum camelliae]